MSERTLLLLLLSGMGGICAVIGSTSLYHSARLVRRGRRATGTVIAYQQTDSWSRDSRGLSQRDPFFHPVVEFTDDAGVIHRVQIELGAQRLELAHGESVRIVYEPDKMHEAQIETFGQLWAFGLVVGGIGTLLLAAAVAVLLL